MPRTLNAYDIHHEEPYADTVAITARPGLLASIAEDVLMDQSSADMNDTRTVILDTDCILSYRDHMEARPLTTFVGHVQAQWLLDVLRKGRVTSWIHSHRPGNRAIVYL